jgi:hypothetical protein
MSKRYIECPNTRLFCLPQDLSLVLSNISNFMKDVVCEVLLRDTEVLTLRHIMKTRKVRTHDSFRSIMSLTLSEQNT